MKKILLLFILFNIAACESPPVRRAELIAEHPEWDTLTVQMITEGYLLKGMTSDQVRASWGRPCWTCTGTVKDKDWENWMSWEYQTQIVFFDKNQKVIRWTKK